MSTTTHPPPLEKCSVIALSQKICTLAARKIPERLDYIQSFLLSSTGDADASGSKLGRVCMCALVLLSTVYLYCAIVLLTIV